MNEDFTHQARHFYGVAARMLGWTPDTFWAATPAELTDALTDPAAENGEGMDRAALDALLELHDG